MDSIIVAFSNDNNRNRIAEILESSNHIPRKLCRSGKEAIRTVRELGRPPASMPPAHGAKRP